MISDRYLLKCGKIVFLLFIIAFSSCRKQEEPALSPVFIYPSCVSDSLIGNDPETGYYFLSVGRCGGEYKLTWDMEFDRAQISSGDNIYAGTPMDDPKPVLELGNEYIHLRITDNITEIFISPSDTNRILSVDFIPSTKYFGPDAELEYNGVSAPWVSGYEQYALKYGVPDGRMLHYMLGHGQLFICQLPVDQAIPYPDFLPLIQKQTPEGI